MESRSVSNKSRAFREAVLTSKARQIIEGSTSEVVVDFLRLRLLRLPFDKSVSILMEMILNRQLSRIYFVNAHTVVTSEQDLALKQSLSRGDILLPDGSGVLWSSRLLGNPIKFNLNGTDLIPAVCAAGQSHGLSVYLLGAQKGVAAKAAEKLQASYPNLIIAGSQDGYFSSQELDQILSNIRQANPHLLLVAMGVPRQEVWVDKNAQHLPGITCVGVGGLFDFLAECVPRAPYYVRFLGMEWLWRMLIEPRRLWYRYTVGNLKFIQIVFRALYPYTDSEMK